MRLSPNGRRLVYVAGLGEHPPAPMVTVVLEDGRSVPIEPGHHPAWISEHAAFWCPQSDGDARIAAGVEGWKPHAYLFEPENVILPAGNTLAAANLVVAVHRTDPRRVILSTGRVILGATDPALSDDGVWLAYIRPDEPREGAARLMVERVDGTVVPRQLAESASRPRFGGTTLAWEVGRGIIAANPDVSNPANPSTSFALPSVWHCTKPVPVWVPTRHELFLLFVADAGAEGHIYLSTWTSLKSGEPRGYALGTSDGSAYDHDARPVGLDQVAVQWLDPLGVPDGLTVTLTALRSTLAPPVRPEPPPVLPDIPWTTDLARTVEDLLVYVRESATAEKVIDAERGVLWCHKSPERPNWGERFGYDKDSIGLFEDTSTGTRMVSVARPAEPNRPGKNLTRTRLSPEEILERNARGENLGDPLTMPLAGYTFTPNSLFMPRRFTGRFERTFDTLLDWWDEPSRRPVSGVSPPRGRWELHRERFQIIAEAGYGRYNGYEVFARTHYGKPDGAVEWNYWGSQGRIRFENWIRQPDGSMVEEVAARSQRPARQPTNARGPYVESRFPYEFPITPSASLPAKPLPGQTTEPTPPKEPAQMPLPNDAQMLNAMRRIHIEGYMGELKRAGGIFETPDDSSQIRDPRVDGVKIDDFSLSVWTGRYVAYFSLATIGDPHETAIRRVIADLHNSDEARQKRGDVTPPVSEPPVSEPGPIAGRAYVEAGRLRDRDRWINWQAMSTFTLIGHVMQGRHAEAVRQQRRAAHAGRYLRLFCMLEPVPGAFPGVSPFHPEQAGWETAARTIIDAGASIGQRAELNIFADCAPHFGHTLCPSQADRLRVLRQVGRAFRDHPAVLFTLWNEYYQNGVERGDERSMLELADELAQILGHRDFGISDPGLDDGSESGSPRQRELIAMFAEHCTIGLSHPDRTEDQPGRVRTVEHLKAVVEIHRDAAPHQWVYIREPRGFASSLQPGRRDNRPAVAVAEAATAAVFGAGICYHHIAEQDDATPGLTESAVAQRIATSPDYVFTNANLGGSWVGEVVGYDKVRPCHNGRIGYAAAIGDAKGPIQARPGWDVDVLTELESGEGDDRVMAGVYRGSLR